MVDKCNGCPELKTIQIYEWEIYERFLKVNLAMRNNMEWRRELSRDIGLEEIELDDYFSILERDLEVLNSMTHDEKRKLTGETIFKVLAERRGRLKTYG